MVCCDIPSDQVLAVVVPIVVYWVYSGFYMMLGSFSDKYRLHSRKDEDMKNLVSKHGSAIGVLSQQLMQASVAFIIFKITYDSKNIGEVQTTFTVIARQFLIGMLVMDAWQYFWHRYMHLNKFLYKHIHSWHHRLVVPYAFGAMYNHPIEGFLMDTAGGCLAFMISGMTPRTSIFFFSFSTIKAVDDHCGLWLPWNLFHVFFWNNTVYHDVHHQLYGNKYNFSQPFFISWDKIFRTYMPFTIQERAGGRGLEVRPVKTIG